jgi:hypothetical protein
MGPHGRDRHQIGSRTLVLEIQANKSWKQGRASVQTPADNVTQFQIQKVLGASRIETATSLRRSSVLVLVHGACNQEEHLALHPRLAGSIVAHFSAERHSNSIQSANVHLLQQSFASRDLFHKRSYLA